ncbi:MAG TPA: ribonuclease P protein component [Dehalococcoidia bacterium]|nr:ribonuclease P protein component [Dehalococcoidia bacterium]HIK89480.1 ribonuclease P protein component [Dehalococcoidia bacterium]
MSLPTKQRIRKPAEFRRVFAHGRRASNPLTNVVAAPNDLSYVRVGLSVSKRVGSAVTRNLVKRRIRNAFASMNITEGWDVVVTAKPQSSLVAYSELDEAIQKSIIRLGIEFTPDSGQAVL